MRYGFEQFDEFGEAVIADATLSSEVVVVSWHEPTEWHPILWTMFEQIDSIGRKLFGSLDFFARLVATRQRDRHFGTGTGHLTSKLV